MCVELPTGRPADRPRPLDSQTDVVCSWGRFLITSCLSLPVGAVIKCTMHFWVDVGLVSSGVGFLSDNNVMAVDGENLEREAASKSLNYKHQVIWI